MTLYESLLARRDAERARRAEALLVVDGEAQPWEDTPQGRLKWYLHPDLTDRALQTLGLYVQELPPRSRSGRYRWQGGEMIVFLEGRGTSEVDGERFEWEAGDALCVPVREAGVELCHHNPHDEPARFVCAWPNFPAVLGVDLGAGLEQLENASQSYSASGVPEFRTVELRNASSEPSPTGVPQFRGLEPGNATLSDGAPERTS